MARDKDVVLKVEQMFVEVIHPLTPDKHKELENSIKADGVTEPITVWCGNIIIDGHKRYALAKKYNKRFTTVELPSSTFNSRGEALLYILEQQLQRDDLSTEVKRDLCKRWIQTLDSNECRNRKKTFKGKGSSSKYLSTLINAEGFSWQCINRYEMAYRFGDVQAIAEITNGGSIYTAGANSSKRKSIKNVRESKKDRNSAEMEKFVDGVIQGEVLSVFPNGLSAFSESDLDKLLCNSVKYSEAMQALLVLQYVPYVQADKKRHKVPPITDKEGKPKSPDCRQFTLKKYRLHTDLVRWYLNLVDIMKKVVNFVEKDYVESLLQDVFRRNKTLNTAYNELMQGRFLTCSKCGVEKSVSEFSRYRWECKECGNKSKSVNNNLRSDREAGIIAAVKRTEEAVKQAAEDDIRRKAIFDGREAPDKTPDELEVERVLRTIDTTLKTSMGELDVLLRRLPKDKSVAIANSTDKLVAGYIDVLAYIKNELEAQ